MYLAAFIFLYLFLVSLSVSPAHYFTAFHPRCFVFYGNLELNLILSDYKVSCCSNSGIQKASSHSSSGDTVY